MENIGPNRSSARQYLLITFLITFVVSISTYLYCADYVSYNIWNSVTSKSNKPYISIKTLDLNDTQIDDLKRLGLTPKKSVEIVKPDNSKQTIHGRFLHITDFHIDHHYQKGSDIDKVCHGGEGKASKYGDAILGCDSPPILVEETFKWITDNLIDKIDFIVYTGDSARHDNDREYPRTRQHIFNMNKEISDKFVTLTSESDGQPLIYPVSNNDIMPHNLMDTGPSLQTRELFEAWRPFIPQVQMHTYLMGAYYFQEVIPNQLAVLSLNTMYWFDSNPMVDDCDNKGDPGYKLFEWLGYVLKEMRARNMKVWLCGHVPPNEKNYDTTCLRKYIAWTHEYRDVIVGGLYGHMNLDHFIPLDSVQAYKSIQKDFKDEFKQKSVFSVEDEDDLALEDSNLYKALDENFSDKFFRVTGGVPNNKVTYLETLREELYAPLKGKKKSGEHFERYSIAHVTASIIPTFNPGMRVWEYNITDLEDKLQQVKFEPWDKFFAGVERMIEVQSNYVDEKDNDEMNWQEMDDITIERKKKHKKKNRKKKKDHTFPKPMPENLPLGPAYIEQTFTPERYVQYYADLESINKGKKEFGYEIEYSTDDSLYGLKALTVEEWIKFGRKLGEPVKDLKNNVNKGKKKKNNGKKYKKLQQIWNAYLKHAFISSDYEHKGYG
ncbi:endopolyphosphatase [Candida albicans P87]|nr:endopolyphosphatase [Candida albicans P87]KGU24017.1 endopolyphosphatase [Candida albicans P57055]KGU24532.1 endopolyphosphatase [Candida albicans P75063]KHC69299.1 endopolyphosphatase [Candida albicans P78042]